MLCTDDAPRPSSFRSFVLTTPRVWFRGGSAQVCVSVPSEAAPEGDLSIEVFEKEMVWPETPPVPEPKPGEPLTAVVIEPQEVKKVHVQHTITIPAGRLSVHSYL